MNPSIWNLPSEEDVWKSMFAKSRPGILLARSLNPRGNSSPGRDILCDDCWPNDCRCR